MDQTSTLIEHIVEAWTQLQTQQPLVQCMTNSVAANYAANVLLAAGASPAMIDNPFEAESFTTISAALSINLVRQPVNKCKPCTFLHKRRSAPTRLGYLTLWVMGRF